ncbi:putative F-box protein [Iris pallida]|uniref:F-box protein n=1 Tax=Iris pallida TaxID=29817 RepID=A0AAX6GCB4_IRIPA|nr:putative F-box protein [Iris pallida]
MGNFTSRACNILRASIVGSGGGRDRDRDWSGLPDELLGSIAERLPMPDHARLRAVCASWASAAPAHPPSASHFPWLMLADDERRRGGGFHSFHSPPDSRSYRLRGTRRPPVEASSAAACVGARDGRLVMLEAGTSAASYLLNPVTGARTDLPSLGTLPWTKTFFDVRKAVVSSAAPGAAGLVAAAVVYSLSCCHLAFARPGDGAWTPLDPSCPPSQRVEDIAHHDGKLFALFTGGQVRSFDLTAASPQASGLYGTACAAEDDVAAAAAGPAHASCHVQLVSSPSGGLLRVRSQREKLSGITTKLSVARLDVESDCGWTEIKDLGDQSLFLDSKCSLSLSTTGDVGDVRKNCVYFVDQVPHSGKIEVGNLRTFDMSKGIIEHFRPRSSRIKDRQQLMAPIWFVPSLL